jgi:HEAT repeat protein
VPTTQSSTADRLAALGALRDPERTPALLAAFEDPVPAVRDYAIRLAARHLEPQLLGTLVADGENAARRNGALAALEAQGPYAVPYLCDLLTDADAELVMFALQVLTRIGDPAATAAIAPLVRHPDLNVAQAAIEALGRFRTADAAPALVARLQGDLWLQLAAVNALGEIGAPAAVEPLLSLVPDSLVAEQAVRALQRIAAPESLPALLGLLVRVSERPLRDAILEAAGVLLDLHPEPAPLASACLESFEPSARAELVGFLGGILGGPAGPEAPAVQAAASVALAAGLAPLYPPILARVADPLASWAELLWRQHARTTPAEVTALLTHPDPDVRRGTLRAARFTADDLPAVRARLDDSRPAVRAAACRALGLLGDASATAALVERLGSAEPDERLEAAHAIGRLGGAALSELRPLLRPTADEPTLLAALEALRAAEDAALEREVLALLDGGSAPVRSAALRALAAMPGSRADVALVRALADRDESVQVEALELLVARGGARTGTTLVALLSAADSLRFRVIRALGRLRLADAAPKLERLYAEAPLHERVEIVRALAAINPRGVTDFLKVRLRAREPEVRRMAAFGLADVGGPDELPTFLALAEHEDWALRNEAARALGRLGVPETRGALLMLARDVEPTVARTARLSLGALREGAGAAA